MGQEEDEALEDSVFMTQEEMRNVLPPTQDDESSINAMDTTSKNHNSGRRYRTKYKLPKRHEVSNKLSPTVPNTNIKRFAQMRVPFMCRNNLLAKQPSYS